VIEVEARCESHSSMTDSMRDSTVCLSERIRNIVLGDVDVKAALT